MHGTQHLLLHKTCSVLSSPHWKPEQLHWLLFPWVHHEHSGFVATVHGYLDSLFSVAWGPPQFQEKRSRSEKAILGALGEFRGILGAALGIRNSIFGMASHDLNNTKTTLLGASPGAIPRIDGNPHERFSALFREFGWSLRRRSSAVGKILSLFSPSTWKLLDKK